MANNSFICAAILWKFYMETYWEMVMMMVTFIHTKDVNLPGRSEVSPTYPSGRQLSDWKEGLVLIKRVTDGDLKTTDSVTVNRDDVFADGKGFSGRLLVLPSQTGQALKRVAPVSIDGMIASTIKMEGNQRVAGTWLHPHSHICGEVGKEQEINWVQGPILGWGTLVAWKQTL